MFRYSTTLSNTFKHVNAGRYLSTCTKLAASPQADRTLAMPIVFLSVQGWDNGGLEYVQLDCIAAHSQAYFVVLQCVAKLGTLDGKPRLRITTCELGSIDEIYSKSLYNRTSDRRIGIRSAIRVGAHRSQFTHVASPVDCRLDQTAVKCRRITFPTYTVCFIGIMSGGRDLCVVPSALGLVPSSASVATQTQSILSLTSNDSSVGLHI